MKDVIDAGGLLSTPAPVIGSSTLKVEAQPLTASRVPQPTGSNRGGKNKLNLDEKLVVQCYVEGFTATQVGRLFNCSKTPILRILKSNGIILRTSGEYRPFGWYEKGYHYTKRNGGVRKGIHQIVMEEYLGRDLTEDESVHHINGQGWDNRIENLQLRKRAHGFGQQWVCNSCGSIDVSAVAL